MRPGWSLLVVATSWACGATPRAPAPAPPAPVAVAPVHAPDPDLHPPPRPKLVAVDWATVKVTGEADALALWQTIAPTGADWEDRLQEIPEDSEAARELAVALLRGGNFACTPSPAAPCSRAPVEVPAPAPSATLADPCLRRLLALWALDQLDGDDLARVRDALRTIAALPPPESQLVAVALKALPETDPDGRLELLAIARTAGQHELASASIGDLDEPHLIVAATKYHLEGALEVLAAQTQKAPFVAAITDDQMTAAARRQAITELSTAEDKLAPDTQKALVAATRAADCTVAAAAIRALDAHNDHRYDPRRPHAHKPAPMMRAICVLAAYEAQQRADEASYLPSYVPQKGLELVTVAYEPDGDADPDGDGDPHTARTTTVVAHDQVVLPEIEDLLRSFAHCTGSVCQTDEREFRFGWKPGPGGELLLGKLEVVERPPCVAP